MDDKVTLIDSESGNNLFSKIFHETVAFVEFSFDGS